MADFAVAAVDVPAVVVEVDGCVGAVGAVGGAVDGLSSEVFCEFGVGLLSGVGFFGPGAVVRHVVRSAAVEATLVLCRQS